MRSAEDATPMTLTKGMQELLQQARVQVEAREYLDRHEVGDAELMRELLRDQVLFDHAERRWYLWNGRLWQPDLTGAILVRVANVVAARYDEDANAARLRNDQPLSKRLHRRAEALCHAYRIRSVLNLAAALPGIGLRGDEWQLPPMLLPVANGLLDLRTAALRQAEPSDRIRVCASTDWLGLDYPAPLWNRLLDGIFGSDVPTIHFLQRLLGYAVSGDRSEQILPILWGSGANGKSTIVDALSFVLGPGLCFTTQSDSLMDMGRTDGNAARPFIAALQNRRLVWASESREGARLNVGLVKQLTGDETITARDLYASPVTFRQSHTILLITNHRPSLPDGGDEAIWRRVQLVPFGQRFVDEPKLPNERKRERDVGARLRLEAPGILAWLVRGCLDWRSQGLNPPAAVQESTSQYRLEEDEIGQYISERLVTGPDREVAASAVYRDYAVWCEETGRQAVNARHFGQRVSASFGKAEVRWHAGKTRRVYRGMGFPPGMGLSEP